MIPILANPRDNPLHFLCPQVMCVRQITQMRIHNQYRLGFCFNGDELRDPLTISRITRQLNGANGVQRKP